MPSAQAPSEPERPEAQQATEYTPEVLALLAQLNVSVEDLEAMEDDTEEDDGFEEGFEPGFEEDFENWDDEEDYIDEAYDDPGSGEDDYVPVGHERFGLIERSPEDKARGEAERKYIRQHPRGTPEVQIAILMTHCGLTGLDPKYLGGNHPAKVAETLKAQANGGAKGGVKGEEAGFADDIFPETIFEDGLPPLKVTPRRATVVCPKANRKLMREAHKTRAYMDEHGVMVKEAAEALGYETKKIYQAISLTKLPEEVKDYIRAGRMSVGHGRAIVKMRDPAAAARLIIARSMSVRQAETLARRLRYINPDGTLSSDTAIPFTYGAEEMMRLALGMKVEFADRGGRGKISISYKSPEEAQYVCDLLTKPYYGADVDSI